MKKLLPITLLLLTLGLMACEPENNNPAGPPAAEIAMERMFVFHPSAETKKNAYTTPGFQTAFSLENQKLYILFSTTTAGGEDQLAFSIQQADLPAGYVGSYPVRSGADPAAGKAEVSYSYEPPGAAGSIFFSGADPMEGKLEITRYDAGHQLIDGSYELRMNNVIDPTRPAANASEVKRCDIVVKGSFKNARLTKP